MPDYTNITSPYEGHPLFVFSPHTISIEHIPPTDLTDDLLLSLDQSEDRLQSFLHDPCLRWLPCSPVSSSQ